MSGGHTSGPWHQGQSPHQRDNHPQQRSIALSIEPDGTPFGYRLGVDNDDGAYLSLSGYCSEADARLIAAAPDLLAALEVMVQLAAGNFDSSPLSDEGTALAAARAAIARTKKGEA